MNVVESQIMQPLKVRDVDFIFDQFLNLLLLYVETHSLIFEKFGICYCQTVLVYCTFFHFPYTMLTIFIE